MKLMHNYHPIRVGIAPKNCEFVVPANRCFVWDWTSYESLMNYIYRVYCDDDKSKEYEIRRYENLPPSLQKKFETSTDMADILRRVFEYCKLDYIQRTMIDAFVEYNPDKCDGKSIKKLLKMAENVQFIKASGQFTLPESWPTEAKEAFKNIASGLKNVRKKSELEKLFNDNHVCYYGFNWEFLLRNKCELISDGYTFYNLEKFNADVVLCLLDYITREFKIPQENKIEVEYRLYSPIVPELSEVGKIESYNGVWWHRKQ